MLQSSTALRRYIAVRLKAMREESGFEREDIVKALSCSLSHVRHIETMYRLPRPLEVEKLFNLYNLDGVEDFLALLKAAKNGRDWWDGMPGVPPWLETLLAFEAVAPTVHSYDTMLIPGLFQTPSYTTMVIREGSPKLPEKEVHHRVEVRQQRQDLLVRPNAPDVWCLLDESVLLRGVADYPQVVAEQLDHLIKLVDLPNVHLQVVPAVALTASIDGTFAILTSPPEFVGDPGVAYTESLISGVYYETPEEILAFRDTWSLAQLKACTAEESRAIVVRARERIEK